jgi:hypothetical protein
MDRSTLADAIIISVIVSLLLGLFGYLIHSSQTKHEEKEPINVVVPPPPTPVTKVEIIEKKAQPNKTKVRVWPFVRIETEKDAN